jgi:Ala-tRNA(Pro) deacylase
MSDDRGELRTSAEDRGGLEGSPHQADRTGSRGASHAVDDLSGTGVTGAAASPEAAVYARLDRLGLAYARHEHPAIASAEAGEQYWSGIDAAHCKNLFMRNQKGNRHYLVILQYQKRADLRAVADQIGDGKLSFGSPDRLMKHLGVTPGSVSPFGLIHDADRAVRVAIDRDLKSSEKISFHPNINTATIVLAFDDFERYLQTCGNPVQYITV